MKLKFNLSGGLAGLTKATEIDDCRLSKQESEMLHSLVEKSAFFDMPEPTFKPLLDVEICNLTIETKGKARTVRIALTMVSERLKPLIKYLARRSKYVNLKNL
ncbi:MAG: protealysin inhibitor emfourin [Bacteroidota bacterium]